MRRQQTGVLASLEGSDFCMFEDELGPIVRILVGNLFGPKDVFLADAHNVSSEASIGYRAC